MEFCNKLDRSLPTFLKSRTTKLIAKFNRQFQTFKKHTFKIPNRGQENTFPSEALRSIIVAVRY